MTFGFHQDDIANAEALAKENPVDLSSPQPLPASAFFSPVFGLEGEPIARGVATGFGKLAEAGYGAVASTSMLVSPDAYNAGADKLHSFVSSIRPDPRTTDVFGQALFGLSSGAVEFGAGFLVGGPAGAALAVGASEGTDTYREMLKQGVDRSTAKGVGVLSGATAGAGALLPGGVGASIPVRLLSGAAINDAFDYADRHLTGAVLDRAGYKDMADQYRKLDAATAIANTILGAGFGVMGGHEAPHIETETMTTLRSRAERAPFPSEIDAALAVNDAHQIETSGPGIPATPATRNAHAQAMDIAARQLDAGEPVDVSPVLKDTEFVPHEAADTASIMEQAARDIGLGDIIDETARLQDEAARKGVPLEAEDIEPSPKRGNVDNLVIKPMTLRGFVRKNGGIQDVDGWLKQADFHRDSRFNGVIKARGLHPDKMLRLAEEAGYFPDETKTATPRTHSVRDLYDALMKERDGNNIYSQHDMARVDDYNNRLKAAEQADRLSHEVRKVHDSAAEIGLAFNDIEAKEVATMVAGGHDIHDAMDAISERAALQAEHNLSEAIGEPPEMDIPFDVPNIKSEGTENAPQAPPVPSQEGSAGTPRRGGQGHSQPASYDEQIARTIIDEKPDTVIPADEETISASDVLALAQAEWEDAQHAHELFDAAVNCFLRNG